METHSPERLVDSLNPHNLRGLAHPLRVRLLGLLRSDGPSTATRLAQRLGESSGATSYHLRQLAAYGFIVEDSTHHGPGRERWWRAAARYTDLPRVADRQGAAAAADAEGFLLALAAECFEEMENFVAALPLLPSRWDGGWTITDRILRLTPAEAKRLRRELRDVIKRYRQDDPDGGGAAAGAERVVLQVQILPHVGRTTP